MTSLWYDDHGRKIERLDVVRVNGNYLTMVDVDDDGDRYLKGLGKGFRIESIVRVDDEEED